MNCKFCGLEVEHPYRYDSNGEYWHLGCEEGYPPVLEFEFNHKPSHYHKNEIDVHGYLEKHFPKKPNVTVAEGFHIGNVIKYVSRYKEKNGLEDLEKAMDNLKVLMILEKKNSEE